MTRLLLGRPLATTEAEEHATLSNKLGLAVFASDALSSTAYATEEILIVLAIAGTAFFGLSVPLALGIVALLLVVVASYRQTIYAYPGGGGAYIVARDNLGEKVAQLAGAALLTDYVLTVAVSVSAGVAQMYSAFPALQPWRVEIAIGLIAVLMLINLRGVRESGTVFAIPTYFFLGTMTLLLVAGFLRLAQGGVLHVTDVPGPMVEAALGYLPLLILLRAFASGCVALTGIEAISNGITAFKRPRSHNAAQTLLVMALILGTMFVGITVLAHSAGALPSERETVISQLARAVFGAGPMQVTVLAAATVILIMAANTSFAGFPRLAALQAGDRFLPRQLTFRGSRLVFSWGIVALSAFASILVAIFGANVTRLIPLYAIGVFLSFTLSQAGMVVRWTRTGRLARGQVVRSQYGTDVAYDPAWRLKRFVTGIGATLTGGVTCVFAVAKFREGAWLVVVVIPILVWLFFRVHHHYEKVADQLSLHVPARKGDPRQVKTLVLVDDVHAATMRMVSFARSLGNPWVGVHVATHAERVPRLQEKWRERVGDDPLIVLSSPYRRLAEPIREYVEELQNANPDAFIHVIVGQILMDNFVTQTLHQNSTVIFKLALQQLDRVAVTDVAYQLHRPEAVHDDYSAPQASPDGAELREPAEQGAQ
jgi:amino acid transporter